jgi:hypothetical protein
MEDQLIRTVKKRTNLYLSQDDVEKFILKAATFGETEREKGIMREIAQKLGRLN